MEISELSSMLSRQGVDFEIIRHEMPIMSLSDASRYFPVEKSAPVLVVQTERGLIAFIIGFGRGRLDFQSLKISLGFSKMKMADKNVVFSQTGYKTGAIPLIGLAIPCIFDQSLLKYDFIYGGTGNPFYTLKIAPGFVKKLNNVIACI